MHILIAEDSLVYRRFLESQLREWDYEILVAADGLQAWHHFQQPDHPRLAILDWMMPGLDGPSVCRKVRSLPDGALNHIILLTSKDKKADIVAGLQEGADDYVTKPFDSAELRARLKVGERILQLQDKLTQQIKELAAALEQVKQLQGLLPICCYCKKIRDDHNYWDQVESYISKHSAARFSHGICPECFEVHVKPQLAQLYPGQSQFQTPKG